MDAVFLKTPCGEIKGTNQDGVNRFLGIRYATANRFEYAEEVMGWDGTYEATCFGAAPIQMRTYPQYRNPEGHYEKEFLADEVVNYSEDCLFLNIWAPENGKNCPVLVVIYGGGNMKGHTNEKPFDGTEFAKRGIVVVTLNYRVNVFGIMAIPVGIERGFITREEGADRLLAIVTFLDEKAERFHGAYSHWLDGTTGKAIQFGGKDDGADLVETGFLIEGLLTVQQYFDLENPTESAIRQKITKIWEEVEWDWFFRNDALYWHWSPVHDWAMNMKISGWNEALITYVLAASSPTHPISREVYEQGWARNGGMLNGKKYYDITLPLGSAYGGPMFFAHYSFLGLDPRNLKDQYADYWEQNVAHAKINHAYCAANPKKFYGYSDECWGLTASDIPNGYTASSPTNDNGTIAPTAAVASIPYVPEESLKAMRFFYYVLGDKLFGEYGFKDAFNLSKRWFASSYIAIDQGPIVVMIENHRTGLLWENFMKNEDVRKGLDKLGFTY